MKISLVGSGSLALGLLYPWLSRLPGCELSVISRGGARSTALKAARRYQILAGGQSISESLAHDFLTYSPDQLDDPEASACVECLQKSDIVAVSVGVGQLTKVGQLLARACVHPDPRPLHLLAFENAPEASRKLATAIEEEGDRLTGRGTLGRQLVAHSVIPDRACSRGSAESLPVSIKTEQFGEILLEESAKALFPDMGTSEFPAPVVRSVARDAIPLGEKRKFWLVNGTHTALGVLCAKKDIQLLNDGLAEKDIAGLLQVLHEEWVQVLHGLAQDSGQATGVFAEAELAAHAERMFERLRDFPDFTVLDVLRELYELTSVVDQKPRGMDPLHRLLQKLDDRLAEAVRFAGDMAVPVSGLVLAIGVGTVRGYADTSLIR